MNKEQENINYNENKTVASVVSKWTIDAGTMLPKEPWAIEQMLMSGTAVVFWSEWRSWPTPIGFGAITFEWPDGWIELGCIVVDKDHREQGLGHEIVSKLIELAKSKFPNGHLFALCNDKSLKLFLDNGAKVITNPEILPKVVFGECIKCPKFQVAQAQNRLCCDTPVMVPNGKF